MKKLSYVVTIILFFSLMLPACVGVGDASSKRYTISYCSADNDPVWIGKVKFDQYFVMPGGGMMGGWMMAMGAIVLFPPPPVPKQIYLYWFNYRQQVFYEATIPLKKDAADILFSLPKPQFGSSLLVTGVQPDGTAVVWAANGGNAKFSTWVEVGRVKGHQVEGDVENFRDQTEEMRAQGKI